MAGSATNASAVSETRNLVRMGTPFCQTEVAVRFNASAVYAFHLSGCDSALKFPSTECLRRWRSPTAMSAYNGHPHLVAALLSWSATGQLLDRPVVCASSFPIWLKRAFCSLLSEA
jgi:hypothetical protein